MLHAEGGGAVPVGRLLENDDHRMCQGHGEWSADGNSIAEWNKLAVNINAARA